MLHDSEIKKRTEARDFLDYIKTIQSQKSLTRPAQEGLLNVALEVAAKALLESQMDCIVVTTVGNSYHLTRSHYSLTGHFQSTYRRWLSPGV